MDLMSGFASQWATEFKRCARDDSYRARDCGVVLDICASSANEVPMKILLILLILVVLWLLSGPDNDDDDDGGWA
jgi:hypothetical protein